jgi:hypothetical protein
MSVKLTNNPTCVLTDADLYSDSQKAKMAKNLMTGIPATSGEGDKVLVLDENGDPQLKDYSAGGGSSYTAGGGIDITNDEISVKVDGASITINPFGGYLQANQDGKVAIISTTSDSIYAEVRNAILQRQLPVLVTDDGQYGTLYKVYETSPGHNEYYFWSTDYINNDTIAGTTMIVDENSGYRSSYSISYAMPSWNSDTDEGKVLKIVSGNPTWVTP